MEIRKISAVTFFVKNMKISCNFYNQIPGMKLCYGGMDSTFTTYQIGKEFFLNLELSNNKISSVQSRVIFHVSDVDLFYKTLEENPIVSKLGNIEDSPKDATWGERFFHLKDPDNYQLSFAKPI